MKHVLKFYENLSDQDYFGLISLDPKNQHEDEIMLEKCHTNKTMKTKILDSMASREIDYVFSHDTGKMTSSFQKNNRL